MNRSFPLLSLISILFALAACGEDRTGEYNALTSADRWIDEILEKYYLWNDNLGKVTEADYFKNPNDYLALRVYAGALDGKGDHFSYIEWKDTVNTRININRLSGYGFEFEVLTDPLGTTSHIMARVLYVMPHSPASEAGVERGDWITAVGGKTLTVNNYSDLINGDATTFVRVVMKYAEENVQVWSPRDTLAIGPSRFVELNPFYLDSVYTLNNRKIAYMVYNEFSTGPRDLAGDTEYEKQMLQLFTRFKAATPDAFILDLRYNSGGFLSCAQQLGSLLVPSSALGKTFCTLKYNETGNMKDETISFDPQYASANLNLSKLYLLTSTYTASASEAVINCLKPYFGEDHIVVLGETTFGKPVGMQAYEDDKHHFIVWPVTAYILNSEGKADYTNGIGPNYELNERKIVTPLYPLGDTREYLLKNALSLITTGQISDTETTHADSRSKVLQTSLNRRKKPALILR